MNPYRCGSCATSLNLRKGQSYGMLVYFHCRSNTGYAIRLLEETFLAVGEQLTGRDRLHFAYPALDTRPPEFLPPDMHHRVLQFDPASRSPSDSARVQEYIRRNRLTVAVGVDQSVSAPGNVVLRQAGIRTLVSYWGAPMSSVNRGLRLWLKRIQVAMIRAQPDLYVFESEAMRETAVLGRGIPRRRTGVCYLGVDTDRYAPAPDAGVYVRAQFEIPTDRKIVYYAGHFEPRKGVDVILRAARELVDRRNRADLHFLLLGNRPEDEARLAPIVQGSAAARHVTFGGYRRDIEKILPGCALAVIASTGWDSFTATAVETASAGLPIVASRLQGLAEAVDPGVTGLLFPPGDHLALADGIAWVLEDEARYLRLGAAARERAVNRFGKSRQVGCLVDTIRRATG